MKIAIYGDSFAEGSPQTKHFHWYNILGRLYNAQVTCYGQAGSSTFHSYKTLLEKYREYDLNILLVTHYGRYTRHLTFTMTGPKRFYVPSLRTASMMKTELDSQLLDSEKEMLSHLENHFIVQDDEFLKTAQDCLIRNLLATVPNIIVLPCFQEDFSMLNTLKQQLNLGASPSCWEFLGAQRKYFGITDQTQNNYIERQEAIACHFTEETNEVYAQSVYDYIMNKKPISAPDIIAHRFNRDYYYEYTTI